MTRRSVLAAAAGFLGLKATGCTQAAETPAPPAPDCLSFDEAGLQHLLALSGATCAVLARAGRTGDPKVRVAGRRAVDGNAPVTIADRWHLGSITKSMTATLAALCVEAGEIGWDEPLGAVLGGRVQHARPAYADVSLVHLLSHRSGLPANVGPFEMFRFLETPVDPVADRLAYVSVALKKAPLAPPGAREVYSNAGYTVAGAMLEARAGKPWEALMRERLFGPLGLASAGFGAPDPAVGPVGHIRRGDRLRAMTPDPDEPADNVAAIGPAGRVHMAAGDLLTYLGAHRDRTGLLQPDSWDRLHTPPFGGDYALGWVVRPDGSLWHNGSNTMWYAEAAFSPASGISGIAVVNSGELARVKGPVAAGLRGAMAAA
jgi:CubicO group peptidase (beta-lactamase class C family)